MTICSFNNTTYSFIAIYRDTDFDTILFFIKPFNFALYFLILPVWGVQTGKAKLNGMKIKEKARNHAVLLYHTVPGWFFFKISIVFWSFSPRKNLSSTFWNTSHSGFAKANNVMEDFSFRSSGHPITAAASSEVTSSNACEISMRLLLSV